MPIPVLTMPRAGGILAIGIQEPLRNKNDKTGIDHSLQIERGLKENAEPEGRYFGGVLYWSV